MAARSEQKNTLATTKATDFITVTTYGTGTNKTITAAEVLGGLYLRDTNGGAREDTLPTGDLLAAAIPGVQVGTTIRFHVRSTGAQTLTIAAGDDGTDSGNMTIATTFANDFLIVFTAVGSSNTYTCYDCGTLVF